MSTRSEMPLFSRARSKRFFGRQRHPSSTPDHTPETEPKKTFPTGIKRLFSPESGTIDIVFIHGLTGDREATWTARGANEPWPKTLLPSILPTARVLTFGYDACVVDWRGLVSQSFIANHAWNLLTSLALYRDNDGTVWHPTLRFTNIAAYQYEQSERPVIVVCHSLGGLVCKDALFQSRQRSELHLRRILDCTRGIIFLGTPHHGAGLAKWAEVVSRSIGLLKQTNSNIVDVLKPDSEVLARIQDGFHTLVRTHSTAETPPIEVTCFYEELPVLGIGLIVPQDSAILPGYIPIGIHGNHMDMTKFVNFEDPGFVAVCGELRRWIRDTDVNKRYHSNQSSADKPDAASQHGENSRQYNAFGNSTQKIADGHYFEAKGDQNFGMIPPKD